VRDRQRNELFARARRAASPTDADKRRVRASLSHALGAAAATSVGATASKAAASVTETALAAAVRASATTVGKVVLALLTASAVAGVAVPAFRRGESQPGRATETAVATSHPFTLGAAVAPPANGGVGVAKVERTGSPHAAIGAPEDATSRAPTDPRRAAAAGESQGSSLVGSVAPRVAAPAARPAPPRPAPVPIAAPARVVSASAPAPERPEPASSPASEPSPTSSSARGRSVSDAAGELELMAKTQSALRDGDSDGVLHLVAEHERRYPVSGWAEDREGARVLALCARSSPPEAAALGQRFLAAHGLSTLGGRVRAACHLDAQSR
jgi:hypothetical protein